MITIFSYDTKHRCRPIFLVVVVILSTISVRLANPSAIYLEIWVNTVGGNRTILDHATQPCQLGFNSDTNIGIYLFSGS